MHNGTFLIKKTWVSFLKPKLSLEFEEQKVFKGGTLKILWHRYPVRLLRKSDASYYFEFSVDIIKIVIVVRGVIDNHIYGIIDTPIGHFKFIGKRLKK